MSHLPPHSYEEIREATIDLLLGRASGDYEINQYVNLVYGVAKVLGNRSGLPGNPGNPAYRFQLCPSDEELVRDVFWDLFRQGAVTLGYNNSNTNWPFFRLSHFGKTTLGSANPYRFHDTTSYLAMIRRECPDISDDAARYLDEAASAFYANCHLAAVVMLGVAAEAEFLRVVDTAKSGSKAADFAAVPSDGFIRTKITKFEAALKPLLTSLQPKKDFEDLATNLAMIQSVLRIARNEAGHPSGAATPAREQIYVFLQLFGPFAKQLMRLRSALS